MIFPRASTSVVSLFLGSPLVGTKYPFYGVQWHPEKNNFEWTTREGINHSDHAVAVSQATGNFFVEEGQSPPTSLITSHLTDY